MKKGSLLFIFLILTGGMLFCAPITLVSTSGTVQIKQSESASWQVPVKGQELQPGYIIFTSFNSTAVIRAAGSLIEVQPLSQMSVSSLVEDTDSTTTDIELKYGKIKADVTVSEEARTYFNVRSANSTASVRGTQFVFGDDSLFVAEGTVQFASIYGDLVLVTADEYVDIPGKFALINAPLKDKMNKYYQDFRPLGLSDSEDDAGFIPGEGQNIAPKARVFIIIEVIQ